MYFGQRIYNSTWPKITPNQSEQWQLPSLEKCFSFLKFFQLFWVDLSLRLIANIQKTCGILIPRWGHPNWFSGKHFSIKIGTTLMHMILLSIRNVIAYYYITNEMSNYQMPSWYEWINFKHSFNFFRVSWKHTVVGHKAKLVCISQFAYNAALSWISNSAREYKNIELPNNKSCQCIPNSLNSWWNYLFVYSAGGMALQGKMWFVTTEENIIYK